MEDRLDISEPPAPNVPTSGAKRLPLASRSRLTGTEFNSSASIATSKVGNTTTHAGLTFAAQRKISPRTLEVLNVEVGMKVFFPELNRKCEALVFHYRTGWKARAVPEKAFVAGKGFSLEFWNIKNVLAKNPATIFITEGELDSCALVEAGFDPSQVLSVPNGATERRSDTGEISGYTYVKEGLKEGLNRVKRVIWCGDNDGPGLALRADMARLFGPARYYFVDWPEGCKDANDVLIHDGAEFLRELVTDGCLPWPVSGLYRLNELPEPAPLETWSTGMGWDGKVHLAPKTLSVVTGQPGHGKSLSWGQIWFNVVRKYGLSACIASFETRPKPHMRRQLRSLLSGKLEVQMNDDEKRVADQFINDRYVFLVHPERRPTLQWFLDSAEVAVIRHGCKIIQLDPWNRLEASRTREESETDYIARCLREIYNFANDLNCHVQIIAHPAKMESQRKKTPPELEDVHGSKAWDSMVDQGFTVHRPEMYEGAERRTLCNFYHRKARFEELGYPCKLFMNYNLATGRFETLTSEEAHAD